MVCLHIVVSIPLYTLYQVGYLSWYLIPSQEGLRWVD